MAVGLTAFDAGIALPPLTVAMAAGGLAGPLMQRWLIQQHVIVCGMTLVSVGSLVVATTPGIGEMVGMSALGLGSGIVMAIGADAVMSTAPKHRVADAGAIQETAFALGAGTGIALLGGG